jgi:hypothetical protein
VYETYNTLVPRYFINKVLYEAAKLGASEKALDDLYDYLDGAQRKLRDTY